MTTDFLIIGGGPAGLSAALFLAKAKRGVTLLHQGNATLAPPLHWLLPGSSVTAVEWQNQLRAQIESLGVTLVEAEVVQAVLGASEKKIITASAEQRFDASAILLASGCFKRHGFIEGEEKFVGHGVFYNAYQDGLWFEGKTLVVEGKNEQAIREVLYLSRFAGKIYFVVPAMRLEADSKLLERVQKESKVEIFLSASLKKLEGEEALRSATVLCAGEEKSLDAEAAFLYARRSLPQYEFLKGTVEISEEGCILVDEAFMTSIPGVFACGDMIAGQPQLPFVSAAQGLVAAMHADRYLANLT